MYREELFANSPSISRIKKLQMAGQSTSEEKYQSSGFKVRNDHLFVSDEKKRALMRVWLGESDEVNAAQEYQKYIL